MPWLNGLGSPFGIETFDFVLLLVLAPRLNGLGSPFGIETGKGQHPCEIKRRG